ncbi:MAG: serine hydrolase domain-containing protein [Mobilicoccus sp.]|nr:serine hydrolase domain-containing protein [Mobilicoccus sp.]
MTDTLSGWVDLRRRILRVPGVQVCVRVGDEVLLSDAFGTADAERGVDLTTHHLFRVASHSKTFTATAIMQLREDGVLGLDDRLSRWLPQFEGHDLGPVTLRELLGHQGGIVRDGDDADYWQLRHEFPTEEQLLDMLTDHGVVFEPNRHFKYTNYGYSLLGLVIERASGRSYAEFVRERILDPLGLNRVHPDSDEIGDDVLADPHECAWGHSLRLDGDDEQFVVKSPDTHAMASATGFVATAEDLSAYLVAHSYGDDRLLTDATKRLMQRTESTFGREGRPQGRYGLGLILEKIGTRETIGHSGGFPGFITRTMVDPKDALAVSVLTNAAGGPAQELAAGIIALIDLALGSPAEEHATGLRADAPATMTVAEAREQGIDAESFTGRFVTAWGYLEVRVLGERLIAFAPNSPAPADDADDLRIIDADTLRAPAEAGFGAPGEVWRVTRDESGAITALRAGGMTLLPEEEFRATRRDIGARR